MGEAAPLNEHQSESLGIHLLESIPPVKVYKDEPQTQQTSTSNSGVPEWPEWVMAGAAGKFAHSLSNYLETPSQFLYMAYLTILGHLFSDKVTLESAINPQPRLYLILLGESGDTRKSTSISMTFGFFMDALSQGSRWRLNAISGVGSAEGLAEALRSNPHIILVQDELKSLIQKMRIDGSVLLPCVNTLFESNSWQNQTKSQKIAVDNIHLCLLGASTIETYSSMFTQQFTGIGFINRLFIVIGDSEKKFSIPHPIPDKEKEQLKRNLLEVLEFVERITANGRYAMPIDSQAQEIFDKWYFHLEQSIFAKRLDTYGQRLMVLLAVNERESIISPEIAAMTVSLLNYQLAARKHADPIDADNAIARVEQKIRRILGSGPLTKRELEKRGNKHKIGIWVWDIAMRNLENAGEVRTGGSGKYRLVSE